MKIHWMVGGRPGEEGLLQREGCGESHVFTSSEWAAWLRASEIRNFKTDKTGLEDGPGPHPHVSLRIQTLRSTETPSWHFSTLWPALGATPAPSAWVSAWGQAQLRWPPSYESFQKLLTWRDWAPAQQNTCTACDAQGSSCQRHIRPIFEMKWRPRALSRVSTGDSDMLPGEAPPEPWRLTINSQGQVPQGVVHLFVYQ